MKPMGLLHAMSDISKSNKRPLEERKALAENRLKSLVDYAQKNSPYFNSLYSEIRTDYSLTDLPPTDKATLMQHFNSWVTDRSITNQKVKAFISDKENIGKKLDNKYLVFSTSGSTGTPAIILCDKTGYNIYSAIAAIRSIARKEDMKRFLKEGKRTAGLFATNGFFLAYGSIRYNQQRLPWRRNQIAINILDPLPHIVQKLNDFQPAMLGSYPSMLELLLTEKKQGRLKIEPIIIMPGGEFLSDSLKQELSKEFNCRVQSNYSCTEAGIIACECPMGHYHINDDWCIVEPVDLNGNPVAAGQLSDKLYVTNLGNFIQPFIRYEITDRIIYHDTPCSCGRTTAWIEVEGRTDDILTFSNGVKITPLSIYAIIKEIDGIQRFQIIHKDDTLELRLTAKDKISAFSRTAQALNQYLLKNGVSPKIILSDTEPKIDSVSGKFKHIIHE